MDQDQLQQLIVMYSQVVGVPIEQLMQELQQMDESQLQQAVQQMVGTIQQQQEAGQQQQRPGVQEYNPNDYMEEQTEPVDNSTEEQQEMQFGGFSMPTSVLDKQYMQKGGSYVQPRMKVQMVKDTNGNIVEYNVEKHQGLTPEEYAIYGEGNNTRMVPVSALS